MDDKPEIREREDGPLAVTGVTSMTGPDGQPVEVRRKMLLCRCGHSATKPFCDDSHTRIGFQSRGGEPAGRDRLIAYEGREVTVLFNPRTCAHAAECGRIAGHVFDDRRRPWVNPDEGSLSDVEAVITACPSGALTIRGEDGDPVHRVDTTRAEIVVQRNGPYWVRGVKPPVEPRGEGMSREKYVLCRCGLSGNKPFCDGSHRAAHWQDSQVAPED